MSSIVKDILELLKAEWLSIPGRFNLLGALGLFSLLVYLNKSFMRAAEKFKDEGLAIEKAVELASKIYGPPYIGYIVVACLFIVSLLAVAIYLGGEKKLY